MNASRPPLPTLLLAAAALAPLVIWGVHLALARALAPLCPAAPGGLFYFATVLFVLVALAAGGLAWREYRKTRGAATPVGRETIAARYFGLVGALAALIFSAGIIAQAMALRAACGA